MERTIQRKTESFVHFHGATMEIMATANKLKQSGKPFNHYKRDQASISKNMTTMTMTSIDVDPSIFRRCWNVKFVLFFGSTV